MAHFIRKTTEEFIAEAKVKHDDKYDYSLTVYEDSKLKVKIICPEHGVFEKIPNAHLMGQGCPKCGRANAGKLARKRRTIPNETMIQNWKEKWPEYEVIEVYRDEKSVPWIKAICPNHGEFNVRYFTSIKNDAKYPCLKCFKDSMNNTKSEFVAKAVEIHGDKYNYDKFEYMNNKVHGLLRCNTCETEWMVRPDVHIYMESGCPVCNRNLKINTNDDNMDFDSLVDFPCCLYLLEFKSKDEQFLKVGITKNSIEKRFYGIKEYQIIEILLIKDMFFNCLRAERKILVEFMDYQYLPEKHFNGRTECFDYSIIDKLKSSLAEMLVVKSS